MITCCKNYTSRYRACHDTCDTYLAEKGQADEIRQGIKAQNQVLNDYISYKVERQEAARRRH